MDILDGPKSEQGGVARDLAACDFPELKIRTSKRGPPAACQVAEAEPGQFWPPFRLLAKFSDPASYGR